MQPQRKKQLFADTVIRILECPGRATEYWLMNRQDQGFSSRGVYYPTLDDLLADWAITLGAREQDAHSPFIRAYARRSDELEGASCTR
jgi:hypothetical protein